MRTKWKSQQMSENEIPALYIKKSLCIKEVIEDKRNYLRILSVTKQEIWSL